MKRDASGNGVAIGVVEGCESFLRVRACELWASAMPARRAEIRELRGPGGGRGRGRARRGRTLVKGGRVAGDALELVASVEEDVARLCCRRRREGFRGGLRRRLEGALWVAVRGGVGCAVRAEAQHVESVCALAAVLVRRGEEGGEGRDASSVEGGRDERQLALSVSPPARAQLVPSAGQLLRPGTATSPAHPPTRAAASHPGPSRPPAPSSSPTTTALDPGRGPVLPGTTTVPHNLAQASDSQPCAISVE